MDITLPNNWKPRPYQEKAWKALHSGDYKRFVLDWHRRSGKDDLCLHYTDMAAHERIANYWYCLPKYAQARTAMWEAINPKTGQKRIHEAFPKELIRRKNDTEMFIELKCGSTFKFVGSDNPDSLVGSPPAGIVFSEYAIGKPGAWSYLMPILEENGGWAIFNSTPRGKNHHYKIKLLAESSNDWFYDRQTVANTKIFNNIQLERIKDELYRIYGAEYGEAIFQQEYYCSFDAAVMGSIFADCVDKARHDGRIDEYNFDTDYPVHCFYDLGKHDYTVIGFVQIIGTQIYILHCYDNNHKDLDHYFSKLVDIKEKYGIRYAAQWLPHDAYHDRLGMGAGNIEQQFRKAAKEHGLGQIKAVPNVSLASGIQAVRATFPNLHIDARCETLIEAASSYHHEWDDDKKVFKDIPEHDWTSHFCDMIRYLAVSWKEARDISKQVDLETKLHAGNVVNVRMGALRADHFKQMRKQRAL